MKTLPHYSGPLSKDFWLRVDGLGQRDHDVVYALGVALQHLESFVLQMLNSATHKRVRRNP